MMTLEDPRSPPSGPALLKGRRARIAASDIAANLDVMTKAEQRAVAAILERLAATVAKGEVTAPAGFVGRVEGAAVALKFVSQPRSSEQKHPRS